MNYRGTAPFQSYLTRLKLEAQLLVVFYFRKTSRKSDQSWAKSTTLKKAGQIFVSFFFPPIKVFSTKLSSRFNLGASSFLSFFLSFFPFFLSLSLNGEKRKKKKEKETFFASSESKNEKTLLLWRFIFLRCLFCSKEC